MDAKCIYREIKHNDVYHDMLTVNYNWFTTTYNWFDCWNTVNPVRPGVPCTNKG